MTTPLQHAGSERRTYGAHGDDMRDTLQELELRPENERLLDALQECAVVLTQPFAAADGNAIRAQRRFRRLTLAATLLGSSAVVLANLRSLNRPSPDEPLGALFALELVAVAGTALLVIAGLVSYRRESWLVERVKAERLRLLKFGFLIDSRWWCGDERDQAAWKVRLRASVAEIQQLDHQALAHLGTDERLPELPPAEACASVSPATLRTLGDYYVAHRLEVQRDYFRDKAQRDSESLLSNPRLLPLAFFLGVGLVVVHLAAEWTRNAVLSDRIALLAVAIPAAWTVVRVYRSAIEAQRNASRSRARYIALTRAGEQLAAARHPQEVFYWMRMVEHTLESDQREWLRLMQEAEWYG